MLIEQNCRGSENFKFKPNAYTTYLSKQKNEIYIYLTVCQLDLWLLTTQTFSMGSPFLLFSRAPSTLGIGIKSFGSQSSNSCSANYYMVLSEILFFLCFNFSIFKIKIIMILLDRALQIIKSIDFRGRWNGRTLSSFCPIDSTHVSVNNQENDLRTGRTDTPQLNVGYVEKRQH